MIFMTLLAGFLASISGGCWASMYLRFLHSLLVRRVRVEMEGLILDHKLIVTLCIHENIEPVCAGHAWCS